MVDEGEEPLVETKTYETLAWIDDDGDIEEEDCSRSIVKGKRKKRHRTLVQGTTTPSSTTASATSSFSEGSSSTLVGEEDEEMANCLILLSRGRYPITSAIPESTSPRRGFGENYYECKTCGKRFRSFQALGGHRTSHTKLRTTTAVVAEAETKEEEAADGERVLVQLSISPPSPAKARAHECAICGMEFASGQALGGHMRRHRPIAAARLPAAAEEEEEGKRDKSVLTLDLNLPAPSTDNDDHADFTLPAETLPSSTILSSPPALVDCHY